MEKNIIRKKIARHNKNKLRKLTIRRHFNMKTKKALYTIIQFSLQTLDVRNITSNKNILSINIS